MAVRTAGAGTAEQLVFAYNFGKTLAAMHMKAIRLFHFFHVNATVLRIEVSVLGVLAQNIPTGFPWACVALVIWQYMGPVGGYVSAGRGFIAKGIQSQTIVRIAGDRKRLEACERLLRHYLPQLYEDDGELDATTNAVTATFLAKTGELLCGQQDLEDDKGKKILARLECYIRRTLPADIGRPEECLLSMTQAVLHKEAADS